MKKILFFALSLFITTQMFAFPKAIVKRLLHDNRVLTSEINTEYKGNNTYRVRIPINEIDKTLKTLEVAIPESTATKGDDGYFVLPDGRMGFFTRDSGVASSGIPLKMFGMKTNESCFVAIVKSLEHEFAPYVTIENGKYEMFARFHIAKMECAPYEDIIIDFVKLEGDDANYSGMARAYRKFKLDSGVVKPLRERVKNRPSLKYAVDSMVLRVKHGAKHGNVAEQIPGVNEPEVHVYNSFEKLKNMIIELKSLGVEQLEICCVAWNTRGHDGRYPQLFPVEPAFGGETKLREAIAEAKKAGYRIFAQTNYTDAYTCADCYNESYLSKKPDGSIRLGGVWSGGKAREVCQIAMLEKFVRNDFKKMKELGFEGTHHIDVLSAITPRPCSDKNHPATRKDNAIAMNKIGLLAREYFGGFGSECGYDHVAESLDYALYTGTYPRWGGSNQAVDTHVPLWQIVYHGIILSNPHYATVDYNAPDRVKKDKGWPWFAFSPVESRLKLFEAGGRPSFYWDKYDDMKRIKAAYDEYQPMKHLQYEFIHKHEKIADNVFLTVYSDGTEFITNYNKTPFVYKGVSVLGEDYKMLSPKK